MFDKHFCLFNSDDHLRLVEDVERVVVTWVEVVIVGGVEG